MTRPVFFFEDRGLVEAAPGDTLSLDGDEGRHAGAVKRIGVGEEIDLVDGRGTRAVCEVLAADPKGLSLRVLRLDREPGAEPRLLLVQALAKGGRDEQAIETCTEIGIDEVIPWQSDRAIVRWAGPKAVKGRAKWVSVVRAAAKQARRAFIPEVAEVLDTKALLAFVRDATDSGSLVLLCHEEARAPLTGLIASDPDRFREAPSLVVLVGPEGGVSPRETADLVEAGAILIGLGRNVLRSSTAGAVCATLLAAAASRI